MLRGVITTPLMEGILLLLLLVIYLLFLLIGSQLRHRISKRW